MNKIDFEKILEQDSPDKTFSDELEALWHDKKGDWQRAHQLAQGINTIMGSRIHAYLHREEGDISNASYWYSRAGVKRETCALEQEWEELLKENLD